MSTLKNTFVRLVVVAFIAPALLAGCAELGNDRGANSANDAKGTTVEHAMPRVR